MDRNKAHDVLHVWNGNKAENCPVCNGTLKSDEEIINAAQDVAAQNYYPRINPTLDYSDAIMCDEHGNPIKKEEGKDAKKDDTKKMDEKAPAESVPMAQKRTAKTMTEKHPGFMTDVLSFADSGSTGLPKRIKIIPTGIYKTQAYGDVEITKDSLMEMADNYHKGVRAGVPIDIDHDQKAAAGWITDVQVYDDGMYADVDWTKLGEDKLGTKEYRFFSPEFAQSYIDPEHSHELSNVLIAGSLVNRPMFKELPAIAGSEDGTGENLTKNTAPLTIVISNDTQTKSNGIKSNQSDTLLQASEKDIQPMELQAILTKEKSARTSEEQGFVFSNLAQLTDEQKVSEGFVVNASEPKVEAPAAPVVETTPAPAITASENSTVGSEVEALKTRLAAAEAAAKEGSMAFSELQESKKKLQKIELTNEVKAMTFNEKGGRIAPAQVAPIVDLMMTMSEPQRVELTKIIESLPERQIFGEKGSDVDLDKSTATDQLMAIAKEHEKNGMTYSEGMKKAVQEHPELYQEQFQAKK